MGQVSLPRLEKINTTMTWESNILVQNEQWLGPKLFIFHKLFAKYIVKYTVKHRRLKWNKNLLNTTLNTKKFISKYKSKQLTLLKAKNFSILGTYIYQLNTAYNTFVVYTSAYTRRLLLKKLLKSFKKFKRSKLNIKNKMFLKNVTN